MSATTATNQHRRGLPVREPGFLRGVSRGVTSVLLIAVLALAVLLAVVPRLLGGEALTVLTGSMQPTYSPGDVVVSVPQEEYQVGDVVTFQPVSGDPTLVTHRIVAVTVGGPQGQQYITRGDANGDDDDPIEAAQIMGEVVYSVPYVGYVAVAAGEHRHTLIAAAAALLIGYGIYAVASDVRRKRRTTQGEDQS